MEGIRFIGAKAWNTREYRGIERCVLERERQTTTEKRGRWIYP
jgi:hypothetical protein